MANKFTIEQQIVRAKLLSQDAKLENEAIQEIQEFPSLWTIYALKTQKFTKEEIDEVEAYIQDQRKKYPDSLSDLFALWENIVKNKSNILLSASSATADLREKLTQPQVQWAKGTWNSEWSTDAVEHQKKIDLKKFWGYATQELLKTWRDIKNLQEALKQKGHYSGSITGAFDQATYDAVIAFQKTIPNAKYGPDGFVWSVETIPALFGIPATKNTVTSQTSHKASTKQPSWITKPTTNSSRDTNNNVKQKWKEKNESLKSTVEKAYMDFIEYAKKTDKWFAGLRNSESDIQEKRKVLAGKYQAFEQATAAYLKSGGSSTAVDHMRLNIAYYYTDDLAWVSANNQMDIVRSMNLCLDILGGKISRPPSTLEQLSQVTERISKRNPQLADLISKRLIEQGDNPNLSIILSNPLIKWWWEKASDEVYGDYLKWLDNQLDMLKWQKFNTLSDSQKKALDHLRDIRGKDGIIDLTVQNREQMWQMLKYGTAVGAGILATIPTGWASLGALALWAWLGATVATTWWILAKGYHGSLGEVAWEAGINLISFGGGAILFKIMSWARVAGFASKNLWTATLTYGVEWIWNITIWVGTDMLRAKLKKEDLDIYSSIQQNLIWAALPLALRMRWVNVPPARLQDAEQVDNIMQAATVQSWLGKSSKALFEKIKAPLERLKKWWEKKSATSNIDDVIDVPHASNWSSAKISEKVYTRQIEKSLKWLHQNGDSFTLWEYIITKEWKKYRIKWPDGEFIWKTQKDVVSQIEAYLQKDIKVGNEFVNSQVKTHIDSLPIWKKIQYGEATVIKNKDWSIEVVWIDGKVLSWEDLSAFYQKNAEWLLNTKIQSFLSKHGNEKVDPNKFAEWYGKDRKWYNPVAWGKWVINMTWNEVMQPVQTWNAFLGKWGALRTLDNPLAMTNNIAKAIVLRDVKMNWFSTDSAMRLVGRWTIMTWATAAAANDIFGDNLPAQLASIPMIFGYSTVSRDTSHTSDEVSKTAYSTYYAGMLWWNLISQMIGGMPNN
jgi:Putative peptidoglycan binding domain